MLRVLEVAWREFRTTVLTKAFLLAAVVLLILLLRFQPLFGSRSGMPGLIYQSKRHGS